jgi:acetylornithine deacetylase/succinyl-diaminopimelate desuccinylase-like protein
MNAADVSAYIDREADRLVLDLRNIIRRRSEAGHLRDQEACARYLAETTRSAGWTADVIKVDDGAPIVFLEQAGPAGTPRLLLYCHYDVVPAGPEREWSHPPFDAALVDGRIVGRGSTDAKANLMALIKAVDAFTATRGGPPCSVAFIVDGEEESGSPNLEPFVDAHEPRLRADAVLSFDGAIDPSGVPKVGLGTSGMLYVELAAAGAPKDLHAAGSRLYPNPAWRLTWALASIKDAGERVLIDGFYDDVMAPTARDRELLRAITWDDRQQLQEVGLERFVLDLRGPEALERLLFQPSATICGVTSGYDGPGMMSIVPRRAQAKVEFRLVPAQSPARVLQLLRAHLARRGFSDIVVTDLAQVTTAKTDPDSAIARAVVDAATAAYGRPIVKPNEEYAGKQGVWLGNRLGIPGVGTGVGPPGHRGHATDEFVTVEHYLKGIKFAAAIFERYARG